MTIYKYDVRGDKGGKLSVNKTNLIYFKKIEYVGFKIKHSDNFILEYEIDPQLVRKIKLNKINKQTNRTETAILELLDRSIEISDYVYHWSYNWGTSGSSGCSEDYEDILENKIEIKNREKLQSKIHTQKAKQYENKTRFR